jgi:hypothetical protein
VSINSGENNRSFLSTALFGSICFFIDSLTIACCVDRLKSQPKAAAREYLGTSIEFGKTEGLDGDCRYIRRRCLAGFRRPADEAFGPAYVVIGLQMAGKGLVTLDNYYFQFEQGFMQEEAWAAFRYRFKKAMKNEYIQATFLDDPQDWRKSFRELCFELLAEVEAESRLAD